MHQVTEAMNTTFTFTSAMLYKEDAVHFSMDRLAESNDLFQLFWSAAMTGVDACGDASELCRDVRNLQALLTERFLHGIMADLLDNNRLRPTAEAKTTLRTELGLSAAAANGAATAGAAPGGRKPRAKRAAALVVDAPAVASELVGGAAASVHQETPSAVTGGVVAGEAHGLGQDVPAAAAASEVSEQVAVCVPNPRGGQGTVSHGRKRKAADGQLDALVVHTAVRAEGKRVIGLSKRLQGYMS